MAHASGPAAENLISADFVHTKSAVHYRIYTEGSAVWLTFERRGDPAASGKRQLLYSIGSGRRGRSYLFAVDDFVFESPVNWYADRHQWDMAPAFGEAREIPQVQIASPRPPDPAPITSAAGCTSDRGVQKRETPLWAGFRHSGSTYLPPGRDLSRGGRAPSRFLCT